MVSPWLRSSASCWALLPNGFLVMSPPEGRQGLGHFGFVALLEGGGQRRSVRLLGVCDRLFASHCCFYSLYHGFQQHKIALVFFPASAASAGKRGEEFRRGRGAVSGGFSGRHETGHCLFKLHLRGGFHRGAVLPNCFVKVCVRVGVFVSAAVLYAVFGSQQVSAFSSSDSLPAGSFVAPSCSWWIELPPG